MSTGKPISISLGKGKKGFSKPITTSLDKEDVNLDALVEKEKKPLVIPLPEGTQKQTGANSDAPNSLSVFDPKKFGLQVRKPKESKTEEKLPTGHPLLESIKRQSEDEALHRDLEKLPEEPSTDVFSKIPVGEFGLAMLRGMGWDEEKAKKNSIKLYQPKKREPLLGLGAKSGDPNLVRRPEYITKLKMKKVEPAGSTISVGTFVRIADGEHVDMVGTVQKLSRDTVSLKLSASREYVMVSIDQLQPIKEEDADDIHPVDILFDHVLGLYPSIRVQVKSKSLYMGALYLKAATIIDVHLDEISAPRCTLKLDDGGRLVEDVPQICLASIIPIAGSQVMILAGPHAGYRAVLLDIDNGHATVQLVEDESVIVSLRLSSVSQCI